jgi:hypothetical protein
VKAIKNLSAILLCSISHLPLQLINFHYNPTLNCESANFNAPSFSLFQTHFCPRYPRILYVPFPCCQSPFPALGLLFRYDYLLSQVYFSIHQLEYCGLNSYFTGNSQKTCTFSAPQSDILRHQVSVAELNKPSNVLISFLLSSSLSPVPSTSATIDVSNGDSGTIRLGLFIIVIKNQPTTKYIDFISMGNFLSYNSVVPIGAANVSDTSNTVRYYSVDANIHTLTIMAGTDLNNLKIVPFITSYNVYLQSTVINNAGSEWNLKFTFNHQILSASTLKMTVTIQPKISMHEFRGSMLLVNIQQIQTEKSAYLSNPTLTATDCLSQKFTIGNTTTGKLATALFQTPFADFGTSFNGKCFVGFESVSYTKLTQFSF